MNAKIIKFPSKPLDEIQNDPDRVNLGYYILDGHTTVYEPDLLKWAKYYELGKHRVAWTLIGPATISTVFLGIDHNWGHDPPLLFETMVFGGPFDEDQWRCSTWDEAEKQHKFVVKKVQQTVRKIQDERDE